MDQCRKWIRKEMAKEKGKEEAKQEHQQAAMEHKQMMEMITVCAQGAAACNRFHARGPNFASTVHRNGENQLCWNDSASARCRRFEQFGW